MAWIELHQTLPRHPKLIRLASRLRIPRAQAAGHLTFLWLWTLDYAPNGDVSAFGPAELSAAADFGGDAELFAQALQETGWLDEDGMIHDWLEYAGRIVTERERSRLRMKAWRERNSNQRATNGHVTRNERVTNGERSELPNPTQPNPTQPYQIQGAPVAPVSSVGRFKPPSREELDLEAAKVGLPGIEVDKFVAYYASNGWKVGKNTMKSWPHALASWLARWRERDGQQNTHGRNQRPHRNDYISGADDVGRRLAEGEAADGGEADELPFGTG